MAFDQKERPLLGASLRAFSAKNPVKIPPPNSPPSRAVWGFDLDRFSWGESWTKPPEGTHIRMSSDIAPDLVGEPDYDRGRRNRLHIWYPLRVGCGP
jgi:hypothetical protein